MSRRKRYSEETLTEKKLRLKREMHKYKYRYHGEKIKQLILDKEDTKEWN